MPQLTPANDKTEFTARFTGIDGTKATVETVDAPSLPGKPEMDAVLAALENAKMVSTKRREERAPA